MCGHFCIITSENMNAVINSDKSYEEILAFVRGGSG